jgi:hypothetical protein
MSLTKEQVFSYDDMETALDLAVSLTKETNNPAFVQYLTGSALNFNIESGLYEMESPEEFDEMTSYFVVGDKVDRKSGEPFFEIQKVYDGKMLYADLKYDDGYQSEVNSFVIEAAIHLYRKYFLTLALTRFNAVGMI